MDEEIKEVPVEETKPIAVTADSVPLTLDLIAPNVSLIGRTATGLSHAYIRLEMHEKDITNLNNLQNYPHLRYIVSDID